MKDLNNDDRMRSIVEIGNNHIRYYNEILKISNISRTWIFRFQNVEKKKFEKEKEEYENAKKIYEAVETEKKNGITRILLIITAVSLLASILSFSFKSITAGILLLCLTGVLSCIAYFVYKRNTDYPQSPPLEKPFPERFGLGIEMNSGYVSIFAATGDEGVKALRKLQDDIEEADIHKESTIFNMNDYKITVENNDGIISTGEKTENNFYGAR